MTINIEYTAHPTLAEFHADDSRYRGVRGPRNSGKSTGMSIEIFSRASRQVPGPDGVRRTRWAVVRNTYRELEDTTVKTWLRWFREDVFGRFNYRNMVHHIKYNDIDMEVIFRALDRVDDIKKLLSLEVTGAWFNEAREIPFSIVEAMDDAIARYPSVMEGGCTWAGIMLDTNPPDQDHWWYRLAEVERPKGWRFWSQPPAIIRDEEGQWQLNPLAENLEWMDGGGNWYMDRIAGKSLEHILCYYGNQYIFVKEGRSVYPEYHDEVHCSKDVLRIEEGLPVYVGIDFGLTPAAVFGQRLTNGRWHWIDEVCTQDMGTVRFCEILAPKLRSEYKDHELHIYGDPAGDTRSQTDEKTPFQILWANGIPAQIAPSNDFTLRRESVSVPLSRMIDGVPMLMISPKCEMTRKAMAGGYHYKKMKVSGEEKFHDKPNKNIYSHPAEAAQYMMLGAGEGAALINAGIPKLKMNRRDYSFQNNARGWML